jgi:hypothetical protein
VSEPVGQPDRPVYQLLLRAEAQSVPPIIRLRRLLKVAGRALGLKCTAVREITGPAVRPAEQNSTTREHDHD